MALPAYDDDPTGNQDDPQAVKKAAAKRLKATKDGATQDVGSYSQLSSTMPGKPMAATKTADPDKQDAIRRRMRKNNTIG